MRTTIFLAVCLCGVTVANAQGPIPLYDDLGNHHHAISTKVPQAQQYFDQGLRLTYGFNHGDAIRSFQAAQALDPQCAMCFWGEALAYGPNINLPMDAASGTAAYAALQNAIELGASASAKERAYIAALSARYGVDPSADRAVRDTAYARAMSKLAAAYPGDDDAQALYAEAEMDLSP